MMTIIVHISRNKKYIFLGRQRMWAGEYLMYYVRRNSSTKDASTQTHSRRCSVQYMVERYIFDWYLNGNWLKLSRPAGRLTWECLRNLLTKPAANYYDCYKGSDQSATKVFLFSQCEIECVATKFCLLREAGQVWGD